MVAASQPITTLLADPSEITRAGLRWLLSHDERFCIVGEAPVNPSAAAHELRPDLIVLDPARDGQLDLAMIDELHQAAPTSHIAVLTAHFELHSYLAAMHTGIYGYFLPEFAALGDPFLDALVGIGRWGEGIADPTIAARFRASCGTALQVHDLCDGAGGLAERERAVLLRLAAGFTEEQIARAEGVSLSTVNRTIAAVQTKLAASSLFTLALQASRRGFISEPTLAHPYL